MDGMSVDIMENVGPQCRLKTAEQAVANARMFGRQSRLTPNGSLQCRYRPSCYWETTWSGRSSQGQVSLVSPMTQGGQRAHGTIQPTNLVIFCHKNKTYGCQAQGPASATRLSFKHGRSVAREQQSKS